MSDDRASGRRSRSASGPDRRMSSQTDSPTDFERERAADGRQTADSGMLTELTEESKVKPEALDGVAVEPGMADDQLPEGGLEAWMTVIGAWLSLFAIAGYLYAFGVYQDYYTRNYLKNATPSEISWIGSTQLMLSFGLGMVAGKLCAKGYFRVVMATGSAIFTFCLFMLSLAHEGSYWQIFLAQGLGMGIGVGLTFVPAITVSSQFFTKRKATVSGLVLSGNPFGATVIPILLNQLLNIHPHSFGVAVRASGYLVAGVLVVANLLMSFAAPRGPAGGAGGTEAALKRIRRTSMSAPRPPPSLKELVLDAPYSITIVSGFISTLSVNLPVFYIQLFGVTHGVDSTLAFYSLAILNAAAAFGRISSNFLADQFGPFNMLIPAVTFSGALIIAMLGVTSKGAIVAVSLLYGYFSGAYLSLTVAALATLARHPSEVPVRTGVAFSTQGLAALVAAPIQGQLLGSAGHFVWKRPVAYSAGLVFLSAIGFTMARVMLVRRRGNWRV